MVDIWRRIRVLHRLGYALQLVCWTPEPSDSKTRAVLEAHCEELIQLPRKQSKLLLLKILISCSRYPLYPAAFQPRTDLNRLQKMVERFRPNLIWLENYTPALPAMHLSQALGLPLYYRSHNVEYMYARAITTSMGSMSLRQRLIRYLVERDLDRFERKLLKHAHKVYDISRDDRIFWKSELPNLPITWLPPMIDETITIPQRGKTIDFLFIGNLFTANNIEALHWLIESVMPQVRNSLPHARLLVAGSNPEDSFLSYLSGCDGVDLLRNFPSQEELLACSRVVVNPALRGSGITIKTVDALYSGTPWVGTTQAVRGLPEPLRRLLHPTDDAHLFAARMVSLYHTPENYPSKEILEYCIEYFHALPVRILSQLPETLQ